MTVGELMELLEEQNPEADVLLVTSKGTAWEHEVDGLTVREDCEDADEAGEYRDGSLHDDVLLVLGTPVRVAAEAVVDAARQ